MNIKKSIFIFLLMPLALPSTAQAMHISEGILPTQWALLWYAVVSPDIASQRNELPLAVGEPGRSRRRKH